MDFVIDRTDNDQIIDHSEWALDAFPDELEYLEEFYLEWIQTGTMPTFNLTL